MWILKVFWIEMIVFPLVILYLLMNISNKTGLQTGLFWMYIIVLVSAVGAYIFTRVKKKK